MKAKNKAFRLPILLILTIILIGGVSAQSQITTNPGFIDAGNLSRGDEIEMSFFVSVDAQENVTLNVDYDQPLASRLWGGDIPVEQNQYSQESIRDWIDAPDQITVDPTTEVQRGFGRGDKLLVIGLDIPQDAEPGYDAGRMRLSPTQSAGGEDFGAGTLTSSMPEFMFRIPGEARRNIDLTDLEAIRTGEEEVQLLATFENTGTVTAVSRGGEADVVDSNGRSTGFVSLSSFTLAPGETEQVEATWSGEDGGEYSLDGTVDYITGEAYVGPPTAQFAITGAIEQAVNIEGGGDDSRQTSEDSTPLWIVIMVLVVIGAVLYSMNIDPFWIVAILGFIGIVSAILFTGLPNWMIIPVLVLSGVLIYI